MAWQDELNSLDEELSSGRIQADEYRRRRDELLAAASSNPVGLRRIHRQQQQSIADAFNSDQGEVTQQVDVKSNWQSRPPDRNVAPMAAQPPPPRNNQPPQPMQGSEVFGLAVNAPGKSRRWPRFVIAVVVLALVAGGTWWFAFRDRSAPATDTAAQQSGEFTLDRVPLPPDVPLSTAGVLTVDQAQVYTLVLPDEASYLKEGGAEKIFYRSAASGNLTFLTFAVQTKDSATARGLAEKMVGRGKDKGMVDAPVAGTPDGVVTTKVLGPKSAIYEAAYASDRMAVRLVVIQGGPNQERQLETATQGMVEATVKSIPPK
ncbi:MAG: hypothetical protein ABW215_09830 [Kibdelosporangium sp.]